MMATAHLGAEWRVMATAHLGAEWRVMATAHLGAEWRVMDGAGWRMRQPAARVRFAILDDFS